MRTKNKLPGRKELIAELSDELVLDAFFVFGGVTDAAVVLHPMFHFRGLQLRQQFAVQGGVAEFE